MKKIVALTLVFLALGAFAQADADQMMAPPGDPYKKVSGLVPLPDFIPGLGTLYVDPKTLPAGPFLGYDRDGKLANTVYMIPMKAMQSKQSFEELGVGGSNVERVDMHFNAGHPGVNEPHYHIILWHLAADKAKMK